MSKFKVGDKAKVRKNLKYGERYAFGVSAPMAEMAGQTVTISKACGDFYHIEEEKKCHFRWTDEMFEPAPIYASDLMTEARRNPEKYEGKRYKVVLGSSLHDWGKQRYECKIKGGTLRAIDNGNALSIFDDTQLEEIKPEPKPVSFIDAVKAWRDGQTVRCEFNAVGTVLNRKNGEHLFTVNEILNGTWYIDE